MKREEIIPSAARLTNSLRDLGYDFSNAVADLIDNSVAAGAGRVSITIHFDGPGSWIRIADDGAGMTGASISEAMRLGTARDYGEGDLGKFGLGLKTASLSQCRLISVASRTDPNRRTIETRRLDLDHVTETDRWDILHLTGAERPEPLIAPLREATGTVVMWENLDRILSFRDPWGGWAQRHLMAMAEQLELHLGMVFGRFLSGLARRRKKLHITINGTPVEAWDPFVRAEPRIEPLPVREFPVAGGLVRFSPFVVPAQREFSSDAAWRRASGPQNWNRQQGFYVYRADRMIQSGGWSRMRTQDEHTKLARASLEFWPDLDEAFEINISKMRVRLPEELREQLNRPVAERLSVLGITLAAAGPDDNESGPAPIDPHPSGRVPAEVAARCVPNGRAVLRRDRAQHRPWDRVLAAEEEVGLAVLMRGDEFAYDKDLPRGYRAQLHEHDERAHAFDALVLHNLRLVASVGKRFLGQGLDMQDVDQHGVIGLMRAVERFDVTRGLKFSTYATWWIRQAVSRGIANEARLIRVPVHKAEQIRKVKSARALLISRNGHAGLRDLVAMTGLAAPDVLECLRLSVGIVSLDLLVGEDRETRLSDFVLVADDETGPESVLGHDGLRDIVHAALAQLPERSAAVLALRAGIGCDEPMTLDEIGRVFGVTRERIRQIEGKAQNRLRETLAGQLDRW